MDTGHPDHYHHQSCATWVTANISLQSPPILSLHLRGNLFILLQKRPGSCLLSDKDVLAQVSTAEKVLKTDLNIYIESDQEVIDAKNKIVYLETTVKFLEGVQRSIQSRGWDIKNAIEWRKFEAGMV